LIIVEPQSLAAELLLQDTVLLDEVGNDVGLSAVNPAAERREEESERGKRSVGPIWESDQPPSRSAA